MKICVLVDDYMPDSRKVSAKMMHELACEFQRKGHEVTVVTPSPSLHTSVEFSTLDGVTVCRFKSGEIKNVGKVKRAINETLLSVKAWKALKQYFRSHPHEMIVFFSPTIFFGSLVVKLKKLWDAPSYLILRDIFPQWAIDQGLIRRGSLIEKYFKYFEKINYDAANTIGLMSQKNLEWFENYFNAPINKRLEVLYNWAADIPVLSTGKYREMLGLSGKVVYFYGGNMGHAQDMMNIMRLATAMQDEETAHFVLVGAGDEFELVQEVILRKKLNNVTLLPSVPQNEFKEMLSEFDVGLFTLHKDHITHNFPGKLLAYMVQGLPILGSVNPGNDLKETVEKSGAGLVSISGDDETFYKNAKELMDENFRTMAGKNSKKLLQTTFSVEAASKQILSSYVI